MKDVDIVAFAKENGAFKNYFPDDLQYVGDDVQEFNDVAQELSNFIEGLDLDLVPHSKLMYLVLTQIRVAERDAFKFGFNMAVKLMHDHYSDEEE